MRPTRGFAMVMVVTVMVLVVVVVGTVRRRAKQRLPCQWLAKTSEGIARRPRRSFASMPPAQRLGSS